MFKYFVFFFLGFWGQGLYAYSYIPWYKVSNPKNFTMDIHYKRSTDLVHPIYFHHLNQVGESFRAVDGLRLVVTAEQKSLQDYKRIQRIKEYFHKIYRVPIGQIEMNYKDSPVWKNKIRVSFKEGPEKSTKTAAHKKKVQPAPKATRKLASKPQDFSKNESSIDVEVDDYSVLKRKSNWEYQLGLGYYQNSSKKYQGKPAYEYLSLNLGYKMGSILRFVTGARYSYSELRDLPDEYQFSLGLLMAFDLLDLDLRLYASKDNLFQTVTSQSESVGDFGILQKIRLLLYSSYLLRFWGSGSFSYSFSNSIQALNSFNILRYSAEISLGFGEESRFSNLGLTLFIRTRKYLGATSLSDLDRNTGLELTYYF